jgi:hypothetical protein
VRGRAGSRVLDFTAPGAAETFRESRPAQETGAVSSTR